MEVNFIGDLAVSAGGAETGGAEVPTIAAIDTVAVTGFRPQQEHGDARAEEADHQVRGPREAHPVGRLRREARGAEQAAAAVGGALATIHNERR